MTSEEEARSAVLTQIGRLPSERVTLLDSLGRFVARDIFASRALPAFDNSAMDGYALQAASCRKGASLLVIGEQPAGADRGLTLGPGEAIRIFTGAPLPSGADAVIMQEEVTRQGNTIVALSLVERGEFVRRKGADLTEGQKMFSAGEPVTVQSLALLASQGLAQVEVGIRPKVAIISTGDELLPPGTTPAPGQIFESNSVMLEALALGAGAEIAIVQHCPDNLEQLTELFRRALETDALIVSGGVSVGEHDLVKPALRALGAELDLWRVAIKPGKPFLFGRAGRAAIFGLPGNPVSSFVTFLKFVRPALLKMSGAAKEWLALRQVAARLGAELTNEGERPHYVRGRLQEGVFAPTGRQESHALFGLSRANALLRVAAGEKLRADASVSVELWD